MHAIPLTALLAAVTLSICAPGHAQGTPDLHALFEHAWQRSAAGRSQSARTEEADAIRAQSRSWLASAPVLGLSRRGDRWNDGNGKTETETSLAATIYLPGQVKARRLFADRSGDEIAAHHAYARLELAGELRRRLWDAAAAQAVLEERRSHVKHTGELADDVARKVAAGELARSDSLLAQQESASARILSAQADNALRAAQWRLQQLAGSMPVPAAAPEPLAVHAPQQNPRLSVSAAAQQKADAALRLAQSGRLASPTVALALRREQDTRLAMPERSIGLALQIPLGSAGQSQIAEAQALAQKEAALAERELLEQEVAATLELAKANLDSARSALADAEQRADAMREYSRLIDQAFGLGERGLAERIRAHTLAHEAHIALRQQQIAVGRAHADYNQAAGVLP